jgi:hypothetical protein
MQFAEIEQQIDAPSSVQADIVAWQLESLSEAVLENWITAQERQPTDEVKEGSRLLALHRQAAKGVPSFNACRETCREIAYHKNLILADPGHSQTDKRIDMMRFLTKHLLLFVSGKMQVEEIGEFCCSSKSLHAAT